MNKQVLIYVVSGVVVLLVLAVAIYFGFMAKTTEETGAEKVTIELHDYSQAEDLVKTVDVTDKKDLRKLNGYYNKISELTEPISPLVLDEAVLTFEDGTKISIELEKPEYIYVSDFQGSDKHFAAKTPEGLVSFVQELLK